MDANKRPWRQLHKPTWVLVAVEAAGLIIFGSTFIAEFFQTFSATPSGRISPGEIRLIITIFCFLPALAALFVSALISELLIRNCSRQLTMIGDAALKLVERVRTKWEQRRSWCKVHLSTAVFMMFAASGLLLINVIPHYWQTIGPLHPSKVDGTYVGEAYGWPGNYYHSVPGYAFWDFWSLAGNLLLALAVIGLVAFILEKRIRRLEAKQP